MMNYGDQTVYVSSVRWWISSFSNDNKSVLFFNVSHSACVDIYECDVQARVNRWQKCIANDDNYMGKYIFYNGMLHCRHLLLTHCICCGYRNNK